MDTIENQVRTFILERFLYGDAARLVSTEASFIENDVIDSGGILDLVSFVESQFGIAVEDAEIVPANFDSIARIAVFVARKGSRNVREISD